MRIAHVSAVFPPYSSGTGNVCYFNAVELGKLGHEVHVFTATAPNPVRLEELPGVTVHRLRPLMQVGNAPVLLQLLWRLRTFDIVHLHYPFISGAELVRAVTSLSRTPFVLSFHNDLVGDGLRAPLFKLYQRFSARFTVRHANRLCAVSLDHYRNSLLRRTLGARAPVAVEVSNGVDVSHFGTDGPSRVRETYGIPRDAPLLLFVASLDRAHHFKGLSELLTAVRGLPERVWLLIVGDGDLRAGYQHTAHELGIATRTVFVGNIAHRDLPPFYRCADVTVLPSSPPESFGLVLVESLSCGTPVVASRIPGVRTIVSDGRDGHLAEPGDTNDLQKKLTRLIALGPVERAKMGRLGREKVVDRYTWPHVARRLEGVYREVLETKVQAASSRKRLERGT